MKSILLASASIVAFAGAAAADGHASVTLSGEATLGYNDDPVGDNDGFYQDLTATVNFAAELDNGLTAAASIDLDDLVAGEGFGDYELSLTSDTAGLYYGDTGVAAPVNFDAGSALDNAADADFDEDTAADGVLRGEVMMGAVSAALSYGITEGGDLSEMQLSAAASVGAANVSIAYQDGDHDGADGDGVADEYTDGELLALGVTTSAAGADLSFGYASSDDDSTIGLGVSYPVGPVTVSANYAMNDTADDAWTIGAAYSDGGVSAGVEYNSDESWEITAGYASGPVAVSAAFDSDEDFSLEGTYDVGNGLTLAAGIQDAGDSTYVAGTYDLGGGAALFVSHVDAADGEDGLEDFNGNDDYQNGTTVELTFAF